MEKFTKTTAALAQVVKAYQQADPSILTEENKKHINLTWALFGSTFEFDFEQLNENFTQILDLLLYDIEGEVFNMIMEINPANDPLEPKELYRRATYHTVKVVQALTKSFLKENEQAVQQELVKFCNHIVLAGEPFAEFHWIYKEAAALIKTGENGEDKIDIKDAQKYYSAIVVMLTEFYIYLQDYRKLEEKEKWQLDIAAVA